MEHGVIKFVDSDGFTRRLVVRKKSEDPPAISFSELAENVCRVFELQESTEIRIKYKKDGDEVVVEEEMGWQETCYSLSNREVLAVDVLIKLPVLPHTKKAVWQQITIAPRSSPTFEPPPSFGSTDLLLHLPSCGEKLSAMEHGVIKFVDSDGFTRRLVVRKKSEDPPAISFSELAEYVCRVFELQESTEIRIKYKKHGDEVVVDEEMGWQETCYSLSNREVLAVDVLIKLPVLPQTKKAVWQQITIAPRSSPFKPPPDFKPPPSFGFGSF